MRCGMWKWVSERVDGKRKGLQPKSIAFPRHGMASAVYRGGVMQRVRKVQVALTLMMLLEMTITVCASGQRDTSLSRYLTVR